MAAASHSEISACPQCSSVLTPGGVAGHCPRCLGRTVFLEEGTETEANGEAWAVLGDCELLEEIGRGGMGVVYNARQRRLGRLVAVKVLRGGEFAGAEARGRFKAEAENAARLRHPGIVAVYDFGEEQGVCWISMELIAGRNLDDVTRAQPMAATDAAQCVRQIAAAVQHAHKQGVLHRDLKPSNILLDAGGVPHIADFGIARRMEGTESFTRTGQMLGSPGFTAPEQALHGAADMRTDVYGLGAILYSILTSRAPFHGPTTDSVLLRLRESEPLPPRQLNPAVPRDLETICLKCLAKEPARRYASAAAFKEDVERFLDGRPITARPVSALEKAWRWCCRHKLLTAAAFVTAASLIASALISQREAAVARHSEKRSRESESAAQRVVYARDIARAQEELRQHNRRGFDLLEEHVPPLGGESDLRGWEWHYLHSQASAAELIEGGTFNVFVSMSPDGRYFAQGGETGGIHIWDTATRGLVRTLPAGSRRITNVQWLADGRHIASCSYDADVRLHDALDGTLLKELPALQRPLMALSWKQDGSLFACADWQGAVIIRRANGEVVQHLSVPRGSVALAWHPRESRLAVHGPDLRSVFVLDAGTAEPVLEWPVPHRVAALAWHPEGTRIALAEGNGSLRLIDADRTARTVWQRTEADQGIRFMQFTPDGTKLVLAKGNGAIAVLRSEDGADAGMIVAHASPGVASLSVANHAGVSLGWTGDLRRWYLPQTSSEHTTLQAGGAVKSLTWSPDGRYLHITTARAPAQPGKTWEWRHPVWDRSTGQWLETVSAARPDLGQWSPDGRRLARAVRLLGRWFVTVEDFPAGTITHRFLMDAPVLDLTWDPSGTKIAVSCPGGENRHTLLCDLGTQSTKAVPAFSGNDEAPEICEAVAWSPDARTLLLCDRDWNYDSQSARPVPGWPGYDSGGGRLAVMTMSWHPYSGEIAMGRETGIVEVRAAADGRILRQRALHATKLRAVAWHPAEHRLATASADGILKLLDSDSLEELLVFTGPQPDVRALAWSPDGSILASGASDGSILLRSSREPCR